MSRPPSLRRNFLLTLGGQAAFGLSQWAMVAALAKLGSPESVGRFALALAVATPLTLLANMNLRSVLATDAGDRFSFGEYQGLSAAAMGAAFLVMAALAASPWAGDSAAVLAAVALGKCLEQVNELYLGLMQKHERMDLVARSLIVQGTATFLLFAGALWATADLRWACLGWAAAWPLCLLLVDAPNARASLGGAPVSLRPSLEPGRLASLARVAAPLGVTAMLYALHASVPRWFVGRLLGERELGFFAAMAYVGLIGTRVVTALGQSAVPRLAKHHQSGDAAGYARLLARLVAAGAAIGAAGAALAAAAGAPILTLLYTPEYAGRLDVFVWLMAAAGVGYVGVFLEYGMTGARRFWPQPFIVVSGMAALALSCALLIPGRGLAGVAMATLCASLVMLALRVLVVRGILAELRGGARP